MRTTAVTDSKPSKKTSSEDRSRKRKIKSSKRRRDSSSEVSSSEDEPRRSRRKISRRERKRGLRSPSPRKRREVKKPEKKKARKARYSRNVSVSSSGSGSSRSCSTCRSRSISRSRSPARADRKRRGRGREREKGGKSLQKSRYSSPNCSTCSGGYSTRSSNSIDISRERNRKRENSRRPKLVSRNRENKERIRDEDKAKIIKAYGDYPSSRSNDSRDVGRKKESYEHAPETKRTEEEVEDVQENTQSGRVEESTLSKDKEEPVKHGDDGGKKPSGAVEDSNSSKVDDLELVLRLKALENFNKYRVGLFASSKVGDGKDESGRTEYSKDAGKVSEMKLSSQTVIATASMERKPVKSTEHQMLDEAERWNSDMRNKSVVSRPTEVRIKSVVTIPPQVSDVVMSTEENNDNVGSKSTVLDKDIIPSYYGEDQNSPNQLKSVNELANTLAPVQSSLAKDDQSKRTAGELRGTLLLEAEGNKTDVSAAGASSGPKTGSANVGEATQFEKKTFSRMHDGEMVQVSYKVYIPKKTPALARRQLRR